MGFDISERAQALVIEEEGAVVEILDEMDEPALDDKGKPVTITVVGMNSDTYRKVQAWQTKFIRSLGGRTLKADEEAEMQAEFIARCCKGWSGFTDKGQPQPFSTENAKAMFLALRYVQRQVSTAMGQHQRFLKMS